MTEAAILSIYGDTHRDTVSQPAGRASMALPGPILALLSKILIVATVTMAGCGDGLTPFPKSLTTFEVVG